MAIRGVAESPSEVRNGHCAKPSTPTIGDAAGETKTVPAGAVSVAAVSAGAGSGGGCGGGVAGVLVTITRPFASRVIFVWACSSSVIAAATANTDFESRFMCRSENVFRAGVYARERRAQRRPRLHSERLRDLELHFAALRGQRFGKIDDGDRQRNLARVLFHNLPDLLHRLLGH